MIEKPREQLRRWRQAKHWTLERASEELGCSVNHLSNIETGQRGVGARLARAIKQKAKIDMLAE